MKIKYTKLAFGLIFVALFSISMVAAENETEAFIEASKYANQYLSTKMTEPEGDGSNWDFAFGWDVDFFLTLFFYLNIIWYLIYCNFITEVTFQTYEMENEEKYTKYRDLCIDGALYELMYSTKKTK